MSYKNKVYQQYSNFINEYLTLRYLSLYLKYKRNKSINDKINYFNINQKIEKLCIILNRKSISIQRLNKCLKYINDKTLDKCDNIDEKIIKNFLANKDKINIDLNINTERKTEILNKLKELKNIRSTKIKAGILFKNRRHEIIENVVKNINLGGTFKNIESDKNKIEKLIKEYIGTQFELSYAYI